VNPLLPNTLPALDNTIPIRDNTIPVHDSTIPVHDSTIPVHDSTISIVLDRDGGTTNPSNHLCFIEQITQDLEFMPAPPHIWKAVLPFQQENILPTLYHYLNTEEKQRVDKFHFDTDKIRFAFSRIGLKHILARYLNIAPHQISFEYSRYGKPYIDGYPLHFNLSHSENCVIYAIGLNGIVGIDVEYCKKSLDFLSLAKEFCSPTEFFKLTQISQVDLRQAFYRCWTRKEAFIKALGLGLYFPLPRIEVSFLADEMPEILSINLSDIENIEDLQESFSNECLQNNERLQNKDLKIQEINFNPDYMASVVWS